MTRWITCTTCNTTHDVKISHVCSLVRTITTCFNCGAMYDPGFIHVCAMRKQPPNFLTREEIARLVESELRETREVLMIREMRESCMALINHLEETGYLASSEAPEMMSDAWDRVLYDVGLVQNAELSIKLKQERLERSMQKVGTEVQVTVDELQSLEKKLADMKEKSRQVGSLIADLVIPKLDLSKDVAKDDGSPLGGKIL